MSIGGDIDVREKADGVAPSPTKFRISVHTIGFFAASIDLAIIVAAAVSSAVAYHAVFLGSEVDIERYAAIGVICFLNFLIIGTTRRSYQIDSLLRFRHQASEVALTWSLVAMLSLSLIFAAKLAGDVSRGAVALFFLVGLFSLLAWRRLLGLWMTKAVAAGVLTLRRVVLIADRDELVRTDAVHQIRRAGYLPVAILSYAPDTTAMDLDVLAQEAIQLARERPIDSVMLVANWGDTPVIDQLAASLRALPLSVHLLPDHRTARLIKAGINAIAGLASAQVQRAPLSRTERAAKRAFDIALASGGLVLMFPLLTIVAILIKVESLGPIFFYQSRVGFNGRAFRIVKFRSMSVMEDGADIRQATRDDPRATRLGRWLRKTNIDELPQLWNVLRGDMSIVGPRPHAIAHDVDYQKRIGSYAFRQHVKPGLTGWAQVNGLRGETKTIGLMEQRVEHDLYYITRWSFFFDIWIVLLTIRLTMRDPFAF